MDSIRSFSLYSVDVFKGNISNIMDTKNKMIFGIASIAIFCVGVCFTLAYASSKIKRAIALRQTVVRSKFQTFKDIFNDRVLKGSFTLTNGVKCEGSYFEGQVKGKISLFNGFNNHVCEVNFEGENSFKANILIDKYTYKCEGIILSSNSFEGSFALTNSRVFKGKFENGLPSGGMEVTLPNEKHFKGTCDGFKLNDGTLTSEHGTFTGTFVNEKLEGKGWLENNEEIYEGIFKSGLYHGVGILVTSDKSLFQQGTFEYGDFKKGVRKRNNFLEIGHFKNGKLDGEEAKSGFIGGDTHIGTYREGILQEGAGTVRTKGNICYQGIFKKNDGDGKLYLEGEGYKVLPNEKPIDGRFEKGVFHENPIL